MSRFPKLLKTRETKVGNRVAGRTDPELKSVPCQAARYASIARRSNSPRWRGWQCLAGDPVCKGGTMHWQAKKRMQGGQTILDGFEQWFEGTDLVRVRCTFSPE